MRGLAVHCASRRVMCRPYHKFWYAGQRSEPLIEKAAGVIVQAFVVDGPVYLATRSGRTHVAQHAEALLRTDEGGRWLHLCAHAFEAG